ncbi:MAG: cytochrome c class [Gemmatimonadetes bacterium]|nr:cytochrome c class [Gemmatimonadota bacterium]
MRVVLLTLMSGAALLGCTDSRAAEVARAPQQASVASAGDLAARFVSHPENIQPGMVKPYAGRVMVNPYEGNASAAATGAKLFVSYNCIDCHGADGSGAMGPSLADGRWHFGGTPGEVFESIYQGRPEGMPAWGSLIADDQVWMLVSYVRGLQANKNVTTENFAGKTVERTGH